MTKIVYNGETKQIEARTVAELLLEVETDSRSCAIAVNANFVPRNEYGTTHLQAGDQVEVLVPMQGG